MEVLVDSVGTYANLSMEEKSELWHQRYGHINYDSLTKLVTKEMVTGIDTTHVSHRRTCEACIYRKMTKLPHKENRKRAKYPLELIHTDLCGPITPVAWNGGKYFVTFIDDYTHFVEIYVMERKNEVFEKFKIFEAKASNRFGRSVNRVRCDNGKEYLPDNFKEFCKKMGISMEFTIPYTPEQNGVAERMNRTILDKARAMRLGSNLPKNMWNEIVQTAVYLINRSPTSAVEDKTPAEMWYNEKPDVSKLRTFGCIAYLHVPAEKRKKLDPKCQKLIMIGYTANGYRLWDAEKYKIITGRDITFLEGDQTTNKEVWIENSNELEEPGEEPQDGNNEKSKELPTSARELRERKKPTWLNDYDTSYLVTSEEEPIMFEEIANDENREEWENAMKEEMKALMKNETWTLVPPPRDQRIIDCKWVYKRKNNQNGETRFKARLVAKGF